MADKDPKTNQRVKHPPSEQAPQIVSTEPIPEIYIDGFTGVLVKGPAVKLNLFSDVQDMTTQHLERRIVARLTMPLPVLVSIQSTLERVVKDWERDGIIERTPKKGETKK